MRKKALVWTKSVSCDGDVGISAPCFMGMGRVFDIVGLLATCDQRMLPPYFLELQQWGTDKLASQRTWGGLGREAQDIVFIGKYRTQKEAKTAAREIAATMTVVQQVEDAT